MNGDSTKHRKHSSDDEPQRDRPGPALAGQLTAIAGPKERYSGLDDDAVMIAAGRWDALESWAYARKLAAARELVRRRPGPGATRRLPGGTPSVWRQDLAAEIALELAVSGHASDQLAWLAVTLETRLPLTAAALDQGILNPSKAKLIAAETMVLDDDDLAGQAEALIAGRWAGQTWSRIRDMITRAVINVDPDGAVKRRERAERDDARIRFFREQAGTCGLAGYGLPADEALKANQAVAKRARQYRAWGIDGTLEELRVRAYLDLLTDRDARKTQPRTAPGKARKAKPGTPHGDAQTSRGRGGNGAGHGQDADGQDRQAAAGQDAAGRDQAAGPDQADADDETAGMDEAAWDSLLGDEPADDRYAQDQTAQDQTAQDQTAQDQTASDKSGRDEDARDQTASDDETAGMDEAAWDSLLLDDADDETGDDDGQDGDDDGKGEGEDGQGGGGDGDDGQGGDSEDGNGGGGQGPCGPAGPMGPAGADEGLAANVDLIVPLADLAGYAQRAGHAAALGAIDPDLARRLAGQAARNPRSSFRIILTGPDGRATGFGQATQTRGTRKPGAAPPPATSPGTGDLPDHPAVPSARFAPAGTGPDGGYGTWALEVGGTSYRVRLYPIPTGGPCDHRFESAGYQPGRVLRRLVEVRDGECMYPGCARTARSSEFEHATPWPAGRSCACNGGVDCHHHNLLKQDPRWSVTQDPDGSRTWTTPAGLRYTKRPKDYPT